MDKIIPKVAETNSVPRQHSKVMRIGSKSGQPIIHLAFWTRYVRHVTLGARGSISSIRIHPGTPHLVSQQ
jgi:hypothetical protein